MTITRIAALLLIAVSSVAAAPGASMVLVGYPTDATDPATLRQFELLGGTSGAGPWIQGDKLKVSPSSYTLYNLAGKAGAVAVKPRMAFRASRRMELISALSRTAATGGWPFQPRGTPALEP